MILNNLILKKIFQYLILFIKAKWIFKKPIKKKYLVIGTNTKDILIGILKKDYLIVDENNKEIYFRIFLKSILNLSFKEFLYKYFINIVKAIDPKIIICTVDTNTFFWKLKKYFPNKKLILIQNAKKSGNPRDLFGNLKFQNFEKQKIDYIFLMNNSIKSEFKKYIDGKFIIHGSLKSNCIKRQKNNSNFYAFVSQISDYENQIFDNISNKKIKETLIYESKRLLKYFTQFKPNTPINVLPYNNDKKLYSFEKSIFEEISNELNLEIILIDKVKQSDNYYQLDNQKCSIGLTSTLLYENLGRGNKTGFFNYLKNNNVEGYSLNWPLNEGETLISTDKNDYENFVRIMKYLDETPKLDWDKNIDELKENIMSFDEDNSKLKELIIDLN